MTDGRKRGIPKPKAPLPDEEDEEEALIEGPSLESQFVAFVKYGSVDNPGTHITLTQIDAWLKQAGVLQEFKEFIELLASRKKIPVEEILDKLMKCGMPNPEDEKKFIR